MNERQILSLLKTGQVLFHYPLKVHYQPGAGAFGVAVPKRNFKRAVKRNLLKRRVRESFRRNAGRLGGKQYDIFVFYIGKQLEEYEKIDRSIAEVVDDLAAR